MSSHDDVFGALADSTRRLILEELTENSDQTLFELCTRLTMEHGVDMTRQGVSKHLEVLEEAGLIASSRRGKYRVMEFAGGDRVRAAADWLEWLVENDERADTGADADNVTDTDTNNDTDTDTDTNNDTDTDTDTDTNNDTDTDTDTEEP